MDVSAIWRSAVGKKCQIIHVVYSFVYRFHFILFSIINCIDSLRRGVALSLLTLTIRAAMILWPYDMNKNVFFAGIEN